MKIADKVRCADWTFGNLDLEPLKLGRGSKTKFKKQAIYVGQHEYRDGAFEVDEDLIDHWVETGNLMLSQGITIPLPTHHTDDERASRGKITKFEKGTDHLGRVSLYLSGEVNDPEVVKELKKTDISLFSPTIAKIGKKIWARPILHACMTRTPVIKGMEGYQLALSYGDDAPDEDQGDEDSTDVAFAIKELLDQGVTLKEIAMAVKNLASAQSQDDKPDDEEERPRRQLLALSDDIDASVADMLKSETRVYVVPKGVGVMLLSESEYRASNESASHVIRR